MESQNNIWSNVLVKLRLSGHLKLKEHYSKLFCISRIAVCIHQCEISSFTTSAGTCGRKKFQLFRQQEYVNFSLPLLRNGPDSKDKKDLTWMKRNIFVSDFFYAENFMQKYVLFWTIKTVDIVSFAQIWFTQKNTVTVLCFEAFLL